MIADNIGLFEDPGWNIQKFLEDQGNGERVKSINSEAGVLELTEQDIIGHRK